MNTKHLGTLTFLIISQVLCNAQLHFPASLTNELDASAIDGSTRNLIVLIHGWNKDGNTNSYLQGAEWNNLVAQLKGTSLAASGWKLAEYHWETDADTGGLEIITDAVGYGNATVAAIRAQQHGQNLATLLKTQTPNLRNVHFIAHSAGSWAARTATTNLLAQNPYIVAQMTLLDPFIPDASFGMNVGLSTPVMSATAFVSGSDRIYRLENYYSRDLFVPSTQEVFAWGQAHINQYVDYGSAPAYYRVPQHSAPIQFYGDTVQSTILGQPVPLGLYSTGVPFQFTQVGWWRSLFSEFAFLPRITSQPQSVTTNSGSTVSLNVIAVSSQTLCYQWLTNGQPIAGANSQSYSFTASSATARDYVVRVTNVNGIVFSEKVSVSLTAVSTPTITSVSPATLPPSSSPQLITINGTNFKLPGDPSASSLIFYDPASIAYPRTPINVTATSMQYNLTVQSATGTWKVKVVNGAVESLPFSFTVASGGVQLTGLSISGPATVNENASGQFTARAIFSDGSNPTVTPTWSVISGPASILASGQLNAGSVSANTAATVSASYTSGGVTKTASANVTVVDTDAICGYQFQQIIVNPNFANGGSGWTLTGAFQADSRFATCKSCPGYAYLANADGSAGNNLSGVLSQTFTIPANAVEATLDFWDRTTTTETKGSFIDRLNVHLRLSNNSLVGLADIWNSNANTAYTQHSIDLIAYRGQTVTLEFAGTTDSSGPTTFRIDDVTLNLTTTIPPTPVALVISGPSSVTEGGTGQYYATMIYCNATTANVSALTWGNNAPPVVSFTSGGLLTAGLVSQDTVVSIYTTATVNGQNYQAFKDVTVVNQPVTFSSLAISGPSSMNENGSGQFTATAIFTDGSSQSVTPSWFENSGATSISSGGLLTAGEVGGDTTVTVSASHTIGGVTRNASQDVGIVNIPPPVTLSSLSISGPNSVNENSTAQYSASAFFSDGSSQTVNPTWIEDSAATSISIFGLFSAGEVTSDTPVTISASYTTGGITRNAQKNITVSNVVVTPTYTLTVNAANGTVVKNPNQANYTNGSQVILTATPANGFSFNTWSGDATGSQNPLTVTMTTSKSITANFVVAPSSPKQLTRMTLSNGVFHFVLNGPVGSNYVIQVSSDLVTWLPFSTNVIPAGGFVSITVPNTAPAPSRFFRALPPGAVVYPAPPPQLTGMIVSNGFFRFVLNGPVGSNYLIQVSTNLVNWLPLSSHTIPTIGWVLITDPITANQSRRFYRAVPQSPSDPIYIPASSGVVTSPFIVTNGYIYQTNETTLANSGRAAYNFTIPVAGNYVIQTMVNAPNTAADSIFFNIDAEPQDPFMVSDITPLTSGFELRTLSWRGNGTFDNNQFVPKVFNLTTGTHQLIIRGREANTLLQSITILQYP
ncbi:MAG: hypothetical protein MUF81_03180 [Verrucomicrobia bacterium]|nr:hypothetical protein [Verrucomicrobiota bacterium]